MANGSDESALPIFSFLLSTLTMFFFQPHHHPLPRIVLPHIHPLVHFLYAASERNTTQVTATQSTHTSRDEDLQSPHDVQRRRSHGTKRGHLHQIYRKRGSKPARTTPAVGAPDAHRRALFRQSRSQNSISHVRRRSVPLGRRQARRCGTQSRGRRAGRAPWSRLCWRRWGVFGAVLGVWRWVHSCVGFV